MCKLYERVGWGQIWSGYEQRILWMCLHVGRTKKMSRVHDCSRYSGPPLILRLCCLLTTYVFCPGPAISVWLCVLPWPKKLRQPREPNIGACMLEITRLRHVRAAVSIFLARVVCLILHTQTTSRVGKGMSGDFCHEKCMGRGQPRDCAMKKWRLFDRGQRWFHPGERRAGLSLACLNTGCETCAHARGCEQLLLSSIFLFCWLALSLSVFLASKRERWWGRWRTLIWGCKLLTQVVHVALDTLLAKAPLLVATAARFERESTRMSMADKFSVKPTWVFVCTASCAAVATVEWKTFTAIAI